MTINLAGVWQQGLPTDLLRINQPLNSTGFTITPSEGSALIWQSGAGSLTPSPTLPQSTQFVLFNDSTGTSYKFTYVPHTDGNDVITFEPSEKHDGPWEGFPKTWIKKTETPCIAIGHHAAEQAVHCLQMLAPLPNTNYYGDNKALLVDYLEKGPPKDWKFHEKPGTVVRFDANAESDSSTCDDTDDKIAKSIAQLLLFAAEIFGIFGDKLTQPDAKTLVNELATHLKDGYAASTGYQKIAPLTTGETSKYRATIEELKRASTPSKEAEVVKNAFKDIIHIENAVKMFLRQVLLNAVFKNGPNEWAYAMCVFLANITAMLATDGVAFAQSITLVSATTYSPPATVNFPVSVSDVVDAMGAACVPPIKGPEKRVCCVLQ